MKFREFLLIAFVLIGLYGCSSEQPHEPVKQEVYVWLGETKHASLKTELLQDNYVLKLEDQKIATVILDDDKMGINITALKRGRTIIRFVDTDNDKILYEITLVVKYLNSRGIINWGIPKGSYLDYPGTIIETKDVETQRKIEKELREEASPFINAIYTFNSDTGKFTIKTDSGIFYEGSYDWNISSLTLMYAGKVERYSFNFAIGMPCGYIIQADKTEKYQQLYPDADITEVKVNHIWYDSWNAEAGGLTF